MNRQLLLQTLRASAPLLVWATHFGLCYGLAGARCSPALFNAAAPGGGALLVISGVALALCALLAWRAMAVLRDADESTPLRAWAGAGGAVLALVGVAWTSVPALMLDGCG